MISRAGKGSKSGYSLIELLVVLSVITLISLAALPNIFGRNDRLSLDTSASRIRQMLIDARTRSLAPGGKDSNQLGQVYQVSIGEFQPGQARASAEGSINTRSLKLERGSSRCDLGDTQGGFTQLRTLDLPKNIYISSFFPTNGSTTDTRMAVRFTVGQVGFLCGVSGSPSIESTNFNDPRWTGRKVAGASDAKARYLVIELSAQKLSEKRYITIDRQTSEVAISKTNPQAFFQPLVDSLKPKWRDVNPDNFKLSLACGNGVPSKIALTFPRAEDRVTDPNTTDPNLAVFYDISWNVNGEQNGGQPIYRPLAIRYFYDVRTGFETVKYEFETTVVSVAQQRFAVIVNVAASDEVGNLQDAYVAGAPNAIELQRQKSFLLECGIGPARDDEKENEIVDDTIDDQTDPGVLNDTCTQQQADARWWLKDGRRVAVNWPTNRLFRQRLSTAIEEEAVCASI